MEHTTIFPGFKIESGGVEIGVEYIEFQKSRQYPNGFWGLSTFQNPERYVFTAQGASLVDHVQKLLLSRDELYLPEEMLKQAKYKPTSDFSILDKMLGEKPYNPNIRKLVSESQLVTSIDCFGHTQIKAIYPNLPIQFEKVYGHQYLFSDSTTRNVLGCRLNRSLGQYLELLNRLNETLKE